MALVHVHQLRLAFGGPPLLDDVSCQIQPGQRIGLLGRNGAGKTTFLKILAGDLEPDAGSVRREPGARVAFLTQDVPRDIEGPVRAVVATGAETDPRARDATWEAEHAIDRILSRMDLEGSDRFETLSSGRKRRVLLARALVAEPDLLLLDEPTNHLDIESITWLEEFLRLRSTATLVFVTHDRAFLRKLADRILEIDRGRLFDWSCDYPTFLARKEALLADEEKQAALFDKRLAEEEVWIRKGIQARRTRNEGRVRALLEMRRQRAERRTRPGQVRMEIQEAQRTGKRVAELEDVSFSYGDTPVVAGLTTTVLRGDKVGIVGPNGAGKTTLLRLLLGDLTPQSGTIRLGTNLQIAYFDQLRDQLDPEANVVENVGQGYDTVESGGSRRHIMGYLQDFLFTPERARTLVRSLSGGERNRVLLARLFAKPANVIVLDEPTNDLDTETLELLEARLVGFEGTVLVVSHDREFLDNVVSSTLVFEDGVVREYVGGYSDWIRQRAVPPAKASKPERTEPKADAAAPRPRKLSNKERAELASLPGTIERLEAEIEGIHAILADPATYQESGDRVAREKERLTRLESELAEAYERWEALES